MSKCAVLLDGGFVKKRLRDIHGHFPTAAEVVGLAAGVVSPAKHPEFISTSVFRIFYYDSPPYDGKATNPVDGSAVDFSQTPVAKQNRALIDALELKPNFAVRRGVLINCGWRLGRAASRRLAKAKNGPISASDFEPHFEQKGVDIRIALDIAMLSIKRIVDEVVLVTGDSDFIPAMKLARREGVRVYLDTMGHGVRQDLKAHADIVC